MKGRTAQLNPTKKKKTKNFISKLHGLFCVSYIYMCFQWFLLSKMKWVILFFVVSFALGACPCGETCQCDVEVSSPHVSGCPVNILQNESLVLQFFSRAFVNDSMTIESDNLVSFLSSNIFDFGATIGEPDSWSSHETCHTIIGTISTTYTDVIYSIKCVEAPSCNVKWFHQYIL